LRERGFTRAIAMAQGMESWLDKGYPMIMTVGWLFPDSGGY
jgi:rhodanese-related sulfurtransferase